MIEVNLLAPKTQVTLSTCVYLPVWGFPGDRMKLAAVEVRTAAEGVTKDRARKVGQWQEEGR